MSWEGKPAPGVGTWLVLKHLLGEAHPEIKAGWFLCAAEPEAPALVPSKQVCLRKINLGLTGSPESTDIQPLTQRRSKTEIGSNLEGGGEHLVLQHPEKSKTTFWSCPTILIFSLTGQITHIHRATSRLGTQLSLQTPFF